MANVYKLQRYVNGNWVDVQLGQMNNVPVTQAEEATPALVSDEPETTTPAPTSNVGTVLEQYLTLSQIQNEFLSTSVLKGDPTLQTVTQGLATAIGANSVAFGNSATVGRGSVVFGPYITSSLSSLSVPGYWHAEDNTEGIFYMKVDDLDDKVGSSTISELEKLIIRATVENTTYYLVIIQVTSHDSDSYKFSFSTSIGDWLQFRTIIDGLLASSNDELLDAQFTFIEDVARGSNSFMTGQSNITLEENSNALGKGLKATTPNQTVVGQYNANSNALFVVGGGQYSSPKNILEAGLDHITSSVPLKAPTLKGAGLLSDTRVWTPTTGYGNRWDGWSLNSEIARTFFRATHYLITIFLDHSDNYGGMDVYYGSGIISANSGASLQISMMSSNNYGSEQNMRTITIFHLNEWHFYETYYSYVDSAWQHMIEIKPDQTTYGYTAPNKIHVEIRPLFLDGK